MSEMDGGQGTAVAPFRISAWGTDGTAELVGRGATPAAALAATLNGLLAAQADEGRGRARGGRSVPVRAEAPSLPGLVTALAASLFDQVETEGDALAEVTIDGVLRTDDGLTAWGFAAIAQGTGAAPVTIEVAGVPVVAETPGAVAITVGLRRGRG